MTTGGSGRICAFAVQMGKICVHNPARETAYATSRSENLQGTFPTLDVNSQARTEQVHCTDPHDFDRLMGVGSVSSSIVSSSGNQDAPTPVPSVRRLERQPLNSDRSSGADEGARGFGSATCIVRTNLRSLVPVLLKVLLQD